MTCFDREYVINVSLMFFLTKRCWPLLDKSFEEQQELKVSCPQVKWGPVYTLFSDYNVVVLYDGTFVEVNQLQRSTPQLPSKICVVTITISILQSPSTDAHHYHQMLSSYKDQQHNSSQKDCHNHPRSPPSHHHAQTILTSITIPPTIITTITIYAHR